MTPIPNLTLPAFYQAQLQRLLAHQIKPDQGPREIAPDAPSPELKVQSSTFEVQGSPSEPPANLQPSVPQERCLRCGTSLPRPCPTASAPNTTVSAASPSIFLQAPACSNAAPTAANSSAPTVTTPSARTTAAANAGPASRLWTPRAAPPGCPPARTTAPAPQ